MLYENKESIYFRSEGGYNEFVDLLKGVCILFIIVTHFAWNDSTRSRLLFPYWIDMAVPIFMILSGYAIAHSYRRRNISTIEEAYSPKLIVRRMLRFVIPFSIVHIFITASIIVNNSVAGTLNVKNEIEYFIFGFLNGGVGQGAYYYPLMLQLIFVFPVIYFLIRKSKQGLFMCFLFNLLYEILKTAYGMNEECYRLLIFRYVFAIAVGVYISIYGFDRRNLKWLFPSMIIGVLYIFTVEYTNYSPLILTYWKGTSFLSILYIGPIIIALLEASCIIVES